MTYSSDLEPRLLAAIDAADTPEALEAVRLLALGKKGEITRALKALGGLEPDARREAGQALNRVKETVSQAIEARKARLAKARLEARLESERVDSSQPIRPEARGALHPITRTIDEVVAIFGEMGFSWVEGPEVESDWYNFTALNMPADHASRQMQDTFYLKGHRGDAGSLVLRTHTSNMQIRALEAAAAARQEGEDFSLRVIAPGRTYRFDDDATHTPMFHQVEGMVIDRQSHMGHLKGTLIAFLKAFFGLEQVELRFRPSYFPFTEPSAEVDIRCDRSGGAIVLGEGDDWLEILGCGMTHPRVIANWGLDPKEYQGFAFGVGIERIAMLKYGIPDLRTFFDSDQRWLEHYGFSPFETPSVVRGL